MEFVELKRKNWERAVRALRLAERHPALYRFYTGAMAAAATFAIPLWMAAITALCSFSIVLPKREIVILVIVLWGIAATAFMIFYHLRHPLWEQMPLLDPAKFPELYARVNAIAAEMRAPRIHAVYLDGEEFDAVVATTRFFLPGLRRNVLILGYPLLCCLSERGLTAVLAHELGRISDSRETLCKLANALRIFWGSLCMDVITRVFFFWVTPLVRLLDDYLVPFYRANERAADKAIAEHFGVATLREGFAQSLVQTEVFPDRETDYLNSAATAADLSIPDLAAHYRVRIRNPLPANEMRAVLSRCLSRMALPVDGRPSNAERLGTTDADALMPFLTARPDALEAFIPETAALDALYNGAYRANFDSFVARLREEAGKQRALANAYDPTRSCTGKETFDCADALESVGRKDEADALRESAAARLDANSEQWAALLYHRLTSKDGTVAAAAVEPCMKFFAANPAQTFSGIGLAFFSYCADHGLEGRILDFLKLRDQNAKRLAKTLAKPLAPRDQLAATPLSPQQLAALKDACFGDPALAKRIAAVFPVTRTYAKVPLAETRLLAVEPVRGFGHFFLTGDDSFLAKLSERAPEYNCVSAAPPVLKKLRKLGIPSYSPPPDSAAASPRDMTDYTKS